MVKADFVFNVIVYTLVIGYILYINFSAYYNKSSDRGLLNTITGLFQNWIFRGVFLLIIGIFALDLFPYGGFILAVLLTIAFLNTTMLIYKKNITEKFTEQINNIEGFADNEDEDEQEEGQENYANEDDEDEQEDGQENYANEDDEEEDGQENYANEDDEDEQEDGQENFANEDDENEEDGQENYANEDEEDEDEEGKDTFSGSYEYDSMDTGEYSEQFSNCQRRESFANQYAEQFSNCQRRESFANQYDLQSPQNCGPYAPLQRLPFNPQGYRSDESVLGSGAPDVLPHDSLANGEYTTSGVGYEFNMA